jgi:hypothetical protein
LSYKKIFELAEPYLAKNDFGVAHTKRVFDIARKNFDIPEKQRDLVFACLILHDIGGSEVREQYVKGPEIATSILKNLDYNDRLVKQVCDIIRTHHEHLANPSRAFKILYDSDKLAMFSEEEFIVYSDEFDFDWNKIITSMYYKSTREKAKKLLKIRKKETRPKLSEELS